MGEPAVHSKTKVLFLSPVFARRLHGVDVLPDILRSAILSPTIAELYAESVFSQQACFPMRRMVLMLEKTETPYGTSTVSAICAMRVTSTSPRRIASP